jgi:hypothetical protein
MKLVAAFFLSLVASVAHANVVTVTSGEHDGFSRLVFSHDGAMTWTLAREDEGYSLEFTGNEVSYDIADAYRRMTTQRIGLLRQDERDNSLKLRINCECYAFPFELRLGILVIDVRDGNAPAESVFELDVTAKRKKPLTGVRRITPVSNEAMSSLSVSINPPVSQDLVTAIQTAVRKPNQISLPKSPILDVARNDLIWEISKGASAGIVDMHDSLELQLQSSQTAVGSRQLRIGENAGAFEISNESVEGLLTADGTSCLKDEQIDVGSWGETVFSLSLAGLLQEFDQPDAQQLLEIVRRSIYAGFGAEARAILNTFNSTVTDYKVLFALSYIVDLELPENLVFEGMEQCETKVALWAVLSNREELSRSRVATSAVMQAFSGLPLHLRRHLGPGLADRFLAYGDVGTARVIRDAIFRASDSRSPSEQLLDANMDLVQGELGLANAKLKNILGSIGPAALESTATLIKLQTAAGDEVDQKLATLNEALLHEAGGGEDEGSLRNSLALAYASQDKFQEAMSLASGRGHIEEEVWEILANRGSDNALLSQSLELDKTVISAFNTDLTRKIIRRLIDLGFPTEAKRWLSIDSKPLAKLSKVDLELAYKIELAQGNRENAQSFLTAIASNDASAPPRDEIKKLDETNAVLESLDQANYSSIFGEMEIIDVFNKVCCVTDAGNINSSSGTSAISNSYLDENFLESVPLEDKDGTLVRANSILKRTAATRSILSDILEEKFFAQ